MRRAYKRQEFNRCGKVVGETRKGNWEYRRLVGLISTWTVQAQLRHWLQRHTRVEGESARQHMCVL